ncbi:hypothetical protein [Microbacterium sp. 16-032]|uniref:hypothetical protein n=1 Tax=Microbacterium sp. 16-032 TaxID=3239808 RepID=UPI0034E1AB31
MSPRAADITELIKRFDHLRNSGVCSPTTRALLDEAQALIDALSTPPADDVREALAVEAAARAIFSGYVGETPGGFEKQTYAYDRKKAEHVARRALAAAAEVRPHGTVTDAEVADMVDPERTPVERFADAAAEQFRSDLDYDGGEIKRRILTLAHVLAPDHPQTAAECAVCRDDEAFL